MIISRTPHRISLGGGGTDLPSYYSHNGGFVLSAAIDAQVKNLLLAMEFFLLTLSAIVAR
jgi:D-glycero-alpha-D-manno-heptose-7-phosphate kinase